jgi:DNA-binding SARP family transcriptional activator
MNTLRIALFGGGRAEFVDLKQQEQLTATTCALLAYLVLHRQRAHPRDILLNLLWGDMPPDRARGCLNTTLWRLRRQLAAGKYLLTHSSGEVCFNCQSDYWLDVAAFEQAVESTLLIPPELAGESQANELEQAIALYTGDLLESNYCEWVIPERERLRGLLYDAHYYLMCHYHKREDFHRALEHGALILANNPLREDVHRQMMRLYNDSGQRSQAVRQYQTCRQALHEELNIEPMLETRLLLDQITASSGPASASIKIIHDQHEVHLAMTRLQVALETVNQARYELEQALIRLPKTQ